MIGLIFRRGYRQGTGQHRAANQQHEGQHGGEQPLSVSLIVHDLLQSLF